MGGLLVILLVNRDQSRSFPAQMFRNQTYLPLSVPITSFTNEGWRDLQRELDALVPVSPSMGVQLGKRPAGFELLGFDELEMESFCAKFADSETIEFGTLQVAYLETICKMAEAEGKYIRQIGGTGNYAHCRLRVEPNEPGTSCEFINNVEDGALPGDYIKAIAQGVHDAMKLGILAGDPMVDLKVTLFNGSYHAVDSNEMAFELAGSMAFKEAAKKAYPVLLEPVMTVQATVPEEHMGSIIGDINARRGRIEGMEHLAGSHVVNAIVPLAALLRSSARGRPDYELEFAGYAAAPSPHLSGDDDAMGIAV